jgi:NADH dehydrogenase [ubiquinone] 1 alpha subcomplex assembly factor 1
MLVMTGGRVMSDGVQEWMVFDFEEPTDAEGWRVVNDTVMGGVSQSRIEAGANGTAVFAGTVSLENSGGFASVRSPAVEHDRAGYEGIALRVRGDGKGYKLTIRTDGRFDGVYYQAPVQTEPGAWQELRVPFSRFVPTFRGRRVEGAPKLDLARIQSLGFMISDRQAGPFRLEIDWIKAYGAP